MNKDYGTTSCKEKLVIAAVQSSMCIVFVVRILNDILNEISLEFKTK